MYCSTGDLQLEEAKVRYDRAIRLSPAPLVRAHYNLSLLYAGSGSSTEAAREAKKVRVLLCLFVCLLC